MAESSTLRRAPLPSEWVEKIFREMHGHYGTRFLDMWRTGQVANGADVGLENAKAVWAEKLAGFVGSPERIGKALQCLPAHPPTLPEFVSMCRQQHADDKTLALPAPVDKRKASEKMAALRDALVKRMTA